jgi:gamma-glutamyltranspeptidase / glutathione hydrolase
MRRRDFLAVAGGTVAAGLCIPTELLLAADRQQAPAANRKSARAKALCVAADVRAAEAGAAILRQGGNAFDAAVAAGFVEAVVAPRSCGIGGYAATGIGFVANTGRLVAIDANAVAPRAATPRMFPVVPGQDANDFRLPEKTHKLGPLSVAVPGVLGGLLTMLKTWGTLDRQTVMEPAIEIARAGIPLDPATAYAWLKMEADAESRPAPDRADVPQIVPMKDLANTLEAIASDGMELFYSGRIGQAIADHVRKLGGIVTREDMAAYVATVVEPVSVEIRGHTVATPPPAAGGLSSLQMAALFDRLDRQSKTGPAGSSEAFEALLEINKVVWEERLTQLGDPRAMAMPPQEFLSESHLDELLERVLAGLARPQPGRIVAPDPLRGTVHLAAADAQGNVVAWTQTHGGGFGSGVMVPSTGIVLGHGMCRFDPRPGWVNSIAPGKRPLHNMSPIVAVKGGRAVLAAGASGGRTIVNNSAALTIGCLISGQDAIQALASPRLQCETMEPASIEISAGAECLAALRARGHVLQETKLDPGAAHLIARDGDEWLAAAEPRRQISGVAAGL